MAAERQDHDLDGDGGEDNYRRDDDVLIGYVSLEAVQEIVDDANRRNAGPEVQKPVEYFV